ncbi:MAG TPA: nidogen-like domain-containing protein [Thermomicrobiales bacterium]|nr:nidogen-like domain-containing protein [Thermomicrobiales bacterium]
MVVHTFARALRVPFAIVLALLLAAGLVPGVRPAQSALALGPNAMRPGFNQTTLPGNDDGSTGQVPLGFTVNFFGHVQSFVFVNNNGNVTFAGPLSTFTPFGLNGTQTAIIAAFFADVDTSPSAAGSCAAPTTGCPPGNITAYGAGTVNGHPAFGVTWNGVGYFSSHTDKLNNFQLILIDRSDVASGAFDIEFNYDRIQWETGDVSGGTNGLGGSSARAGYSNGAGTSFELPGSGVNGALLDSNPTTGLIHLSGGTGRIGFQVRGGQVVPPSCPVSGNVTLSLTTTAGGGATASPPGPTYAPCTQVSLTATPNPGFLFAGWTVGGVPVGNGDPLGLTMNANYDVKASFVLNPNFTAWTSLGGVVTDAPTATSFNGRVYIFARGSDNALYVTSSADGAAFTTWRSLGGQLTAAPAAASTGNALYVFARGSDNGLYVTSSTDGTTFSAWRPLGGQLTSAPAAAGVGNALYVFARGSDNALYVTRSTDGATWSTWQSLGGILTDAPAAVGFQGVVYVYAKGSDNALYQKSSTDGVSFGNWQNLGGILTAAPAAAAYNPTGSIPTLAVFARGTDTALYLRLSADGVSFTNWMSLGGRVVGPPAAAGLGDNQLLAIARGSDNALWVRRAQP